MTSTVFDKKTGSVLERKNSFGCEFFMKKNLNFSKCFHPLFEFPKLLCTLDSEREINLKSKFHV